MVGSGHLGIVTWDCGLWIMDYPGAEGEGGRGKERERERERNYGCKPKAKNRIGLTKDEYDFVECLSRIKFGLYVVNII